MAAALALGALNQIQNVGQIGEIVQGQAHHREQISWTRRGYLLDSQSLRLDALDHAKEEIKSHYDTYVSRIDTLLLVLALIWPFALNLIQFSDDFVPGNTCPHGNCVEEEYPWLIWIWVFLIALVLVLPFWGILMLIRCKLQLDNWLEYSLAGLNQKRRVIVKAAAPIISGSGGSERRHSIFSLENSSDMEQDTQEETESIVHQLVTVVLSYQEYLAGIWTAECGWLVRSSTALLWMSVVAALLLTSLSIWIFLVNKGGEHARSSRYFATLILSGSLAPGAYVLLERTRGRVPPPVFDEDGLVQEHFPLSSAHLRATSFKHLQALRTTSSPQISPRGGGAQQGSKKAPKRSLSEIDASHVGTLTGKMVRSMITPPEPWWRCRRRGRFPDRMLHKPLLEET